MQKSIKISGLLVKIAEDRKMGKEVNLAVIGAGYWGQKVIKEYLELAKRDSAFNLVQVCDLMEENLKHCRDVLNVDFDRLGADYEAVLKDPDIDAVHICTPNQTHFKIGLQALTEGKNVLLEKPMALSPSDTWKLCNVAESKHLCLQVGHIYRFNNAVKKARELIATGYLGELYYLKLQWTTWMPSPLGRDIIFDLGPHPIDIMHFLLQRWPVKVGCVGKSYRRPSLEEVAYFSLDFGERLMGQVELSWLQPGKVRELYIIGAQRAASVDCLGQKIQIFEDNNGSNFKLEVPENNTIFDEVQHFVTSIRDENNHRNPGPIGAGNVSVLEGLRRSMQEERMVRIGLEN
jgi:UDP-N-acetylglucosamine 3-dehydrogenase